MFAADDTLLQSPLNAGSRLLSAFSQLKSLKLGIDAEYSRDIEQWKLWDAEGS